MPRLPFTIDDALWRFDTARLSVTFHATDEDMHPADQLDDPRDVEFACSGDPAHWFCAWVVVWDEDDRPVAWDSLGGCSYNSFREFYTSHRDPDPMHRNCTLMRAARGDNVVICDCFPSMVREAVRAARIELETRRLMVA